MSTLAPPRFRLESLAVWQRNALVWRRLMTASLLLHFGEPFLYLLGIGYGLGRFVGELDGIPYFTFLASGFIAWSAMNVASMESMWSVYTRMVPQQTYEAILATPAQVDDIVIGELLWCGSKSLVSGTAILGRSGRPGCRERLDCPAGDSGDLPHRSLFRSAGAYHHRLRSCLRVLQLLHDARHDADVHSLRCVLSRQ